MNVFSASLGALMGLHDKEFVLAAYEMLLGRPADRDGMAYYLARLRTGYSKLAVLRQLSGSPEAREHEHGIAGLNKALARYRLGQLPLVGGVFRMLWRLEGESAAERLQRTVINELARIRDQLQNGVMNAPALRSAVRPGQVHEKDTADLARRHNKVVEQLSPKAREIFDRLASS